MIKAVNLGKRFSDYVFRHVDIETPERGLVALIGPNGSGKTTLLKIFALLLEPTEGELYIGGLPRDQFAARKPFRVLYSHQEPLVLSGTVDDNFICRDGEVEERLGLAKLMGEKARRLSGGYKKLLTVARVLACKPRVALLDEPTAYLDPDKRQTLMSYLAEYSRQNLVLWTTHYPPEAEKSDEIYEIKDGKIRRLT